MKKKNAIIGTQVKVKKGYDDTELVGLIGTIVDYDAYVLGNPLVKFTEVSKDVYLHDGNNCTKSGQRYEPKCWYIEVEYLKRIKE